MTKGHNRLAALASEIKAEHKETLRTARMAAEHAIKCGKLLNEAKELVPHGQWLPWLKANCRMSERTARLYMNVAASDFKSAIVAVLGLNAAAKAVEVRCTKYPNDDPFYACGPDGRREWLLAILAGMPAESAVWCASRPFKSVTEWHGPEGVQFRKNLGLREPSDEWKQKLWPAFVAQHSAIDDADIMARIAARAA